MLLKERTIACVESKPGHPKVPGLLRSCFEHLRVLERGLHWAREGKHAFASTLTKNLPSPATVGNARHHEEARPSSLMTGLFQ